MAGWLLALAGPDAAPLPPSDFTTGLRSLVAALVVVGLVVLFAWLLRRGVFGPVGRRGTSAIKVETAVPLGERRSLAVVSIEGRRLLIGLAPGHVSLVTELKGPAPFSGALDRATGESTRGDV